MTNGSRSDLTQRLHDISEGGLDIDCDECPTCEKCGAPITTGLMALLCPGQEECAMWPSDGVAQDFAEMFPDKWTAEEKERFLEHCALRAMKMR